MKKRNQGITLIALIITIVILLILLGVGTKIIIDGRIINSTEKVVNATNKKVEQQQATIDDLVKELNIEMGKGSIQYNKKLLKDLQDGLLLCSTAFDEETKILNILVEMSNLASFGTIEELKESTDKIDTIRNTIEYKGEKLLDGTLARDVCVKGMYLSIDDLSSQALDINITGTSIPNEYSEKIDIAITKIRTSMTIVQGIYNALEKLLRIFTKANQIINTGTNEADVELTVHSLSSMIEILNKCIQNGNIAYGLSTKVRTQIKTQTEYLLKTIDAISEYSEYDGQKLLDGNFKNISEINTTTLGNDTQLSVDFTDDTTIANIILQYENAIEILEMEIAKLGKNSTAEQIGNEDVVYYLNNYGIGLCQEAENAIDEELSMLERMQELLTALISDTGTNKEAVLSEMQALLDYGISEVAKTSFDDENILDGTFARNIGTKDIYLQIDDCSSEGLGLASSTLETDLSTTSGVQQYLTKVNNAITKLSNEKSNIGTVKNQIQNLIDEY